MKTTRIAGRLHRRGRRYLNRSLNAARRGALAVRRSLVCIYSYPHTRFYNITYQFEILVCVIQKKLGFGWDIIGEFNLSCYSFWGGYQEKLRLRERERDRDCETDRQTLRQREIERGKVVLAWLVLVNMFVCTDVWCSVIYVLLISLICVL